MKKPKFTLIDYLIILGIIIAIIFAFIHISTENESQAISFDTSTFTKVGEKYLIFYNEGKIINTTISGYNSTTGEKVEIHGEILWLDNAKPYTKILVKTNDDIILAGLQEESPEADIYIDKVSLETDGSKHHNITDITIKPKNITSFNDLIFDLGNNTEYEITTTVTLSDDINGSLFQELINKLFGKNKKVPVKSSMTGFQNQIIITRATAEEIAIIDEFLGDTNGVTNEIQIRIYDLSEKDIKIDNIKSIREIK